MRYIGCIAAAVFAVVGAVSPATAQTDQKFGYIDSREIIEQAPGASEARQQFEQAMAEYQAQLEEMENDLREMIEAYEQQQVTLSPEARRTRQQQIQEQQTSLQQTARQLEQEAAQREAELAQPIMEQINSVLQQIREEEGYTFIFDSAGGALVAADPSLDLTEEVLTRLRSIAQQEGN